MSSVWALQRYAFRYTYKNKFISINIKIKLTSSDSFLDNTYVNESDRNKHIDELQRMLILHRYIMYINVLKGQNYWFVQDGPPSEH